MAERIAQLYVELSARTDKLEAALKQSQQGLGKFKGGINDVVKGLTGFDAATVGTVAVVGALAAGVKYAVQQAMEAEQAMAATEAVIKATGGAAGFTAREIADMAGEMSEMTGIADDVIQSGQNMLLTFKNIKGDTFERATDAMTDMAVAMNKGSLAGIDLQSTSIQLGKALNDPVKGLTALSRVGVTFDAEQKKLIKTMAALGDVAGAQAIILQELESEFGGAAEAAGNTTAGQFAKLKNEAGELAEELGGVLLPALTGLASGATDLTRYWRVLGGAVLEGEMSFWDFQKAGLEVIFTEKTMAEAIEETRGAVENQAAAIEALDPFLRNMRLEQENAANAAEAQFAAMVDVEAAFRRGGAAIDYAALAEIDYARGVEAAQAAEEAAQQAAEAHLQHLKDIDQAARDATVAHQNLAQSLKDADAAQLAGVALGNLEKAYQAGEISASEYRTATEDLMLAYGLATPASIAMATATEHLNTLFITGQITGDQLTEAIGKIPAAAEDGKVSMDELGITLGTNTNPKLWEARDAAVDARDAINSLESRTVTVTTNYVTNHVVTGGAGAAGGGTQHRAAGGPVWAGQSYMVGEHGPEPFIPTQNGRILSHDDAMEAWAGSSDGGSTTDSTALMAAIQGMPAAIATAVRDAVLQARR